MLASLKLDGRRCLVKKGQLFSRTMKPQPNRNLPAHLKELLKASVELNLAIDGELFSPDLTFSELEGTFKREDGDIHPSIQLYAFDMMLASSWGQPHKAGGFLDRNNNLRAFIERVKPANVTYLKQRMVSKASEVQALYEGALSSGYEGLILRDPNALYKHGRATVKEGIIFKMKPFDTLDAVVIGYEQQRQLKDGIERATNELGRTARTFKQEDYTVTDNLGALQVRDEKGREFSIGWGRGWTMAKRKELWDRRTTLVGQWVEVRFMVVGEKDLPRMPQLIRFREAKE
jgi:DNA ligase-1